MTKNDKTRALNVAPCGLICSACDAYRATQENDDAKLECVAAEWRRLNNCDEIRADVLHCDGCFAPSERKSAYCRFCAIRCCAVEKGVRVCSECADYPCAVFNDFMQARPPAEAEAIKHFLAAVVEVEKNTHSIL